MEKQSAQRKLEVAPKSAPMPDDGDYEGHPQGEPPQGDEEISSGGKDDTTKAVSLNRSLAHAPQNRHSEFCMGAKMTSQTQSNTTTSCWTQNAN